VLTSLNRNREEVVTEEVAEGSREVEVSAVVAEVDSVVEDSMAVAVVDSEEAVEADSETEVAVEVAVVVHPYFDRIGGRGGVFLDDNDKAAKKGNIAGFEGTKKRL
jgi:hypothetical protein